MGISASFGRQLLEIDRRGGKDTLAELSSHSGRLAVGTVATDAADPPGVLKLWDVDSQKEVWSYAGNCWEMSFSKETGNLAVLMDGSVMLFSEDMLARPIESLFGSRVIGLSIRRCSQPAGDLRGRGRIGWSCPRLEGERWIQEHDTRRS